MEAGRLIVDLPAAEFSRSEHALVRAYVEAFSAWADSRLPDSRATARLA
jgi:hypothetical protein